MFLSRDYPQEFKSENHGRIYAVDDTTTESNDTFSSIVLEKQEVDSHSQDLSTEVILLKKQNGEFLQG